MKGDPDCVVVSVLLAYSTRYPSRAGPVICLYPYVRLSSVMELFDS